MEVVIVLICVGLVFLNSYLDHGKQRLKSECLALQKQVITLTEQAGQKDLWLDRGAQTLEQMKVVFEQQEQTIKVANEGLAFQQAQYDKLFNQKKSSEVRVGKITEQIAPFLQDYPFDPNDSRFIGSPVDLVNFADDKITFIEVKSGESQLTQKQKAIMQLVKEGKVEFLIYRVSGNAPE